MSLCCRFDETTPRSKVAGRKEKGEVLVAEKIALAPKVAANQAHEVALLTCKLHSIVPGIFCSDLLACSAWVRCTKYKSYTCLRSDRDGYTLYTPQKRHAGFSAARRQDTPSISRGTRQGTNFKQPLNHAARDGQI